jgi:hypothetical protein
MQNRENTQAIVKLFEMLQLFVSVNSQLKNPGSFMRESTQLMNQMIVFIMKVYLISNVLFIINIKISDLFQNKTSPNRHMIGDFSRFF